MWLSLRERVARLSWKERVAKLLRRCVAISWRERLARLCWREMAGEVGSAPACYDSSLGLNPYISQKYKMGYISKEVANTLWPT